MDFTVITFAVSDISDLSEMLPALVWLLFLEKKQPYNILGCFFSISAVLKLLTLVMAELHINNMIVYHALACLEICFLYIFYNKILFNKLYPSGLIILIVFNITNSLFVEPLTQFNSIGWTINSTVLIGLGLSYLYILYNSEVMVSLKKNPDFIITAGWLVYAAGSLFTYLLSTEIFSQPALGFFHNAWIFQCIANLFKNIVVSYGLWLVRLK